MRTLEQQASFYRRAQWGMAASLVVLLGLFWLVAYRPVQNKLRTVRLEIASRQDRLVANRSRAGTLPIVKSEVERLRVRLAHFDKKLPRQPELSQFLESLGRFREQNGLRHWNYTPGAPRQLELFCERPINMSFDGDFVNVFSFLRQVEEMPRLTRISSIRIRARDGQPGQVEVQVAMNIYYAEGS